MKRATLAAAPQAPLPGLAPELAKRYETTMVATMPKAWECACGKCSYAPRCWNCNAPKPVAALPSPDCSTLCAPEEGRCSITADGACDALARRGAVATTGTGEAGQWN